MHWLTSELKRFSACLAIRRVIGKCNYEVLAKLLESIHEEFDITTKVTATITDNGSNFVKAFRLFSPDKDKLTSTASVNPEVAAPQSPVDNTPTEEVNSQPSRVRHSQERNSFAQIRSLRGEEAAILEILEESPSDFEESEEEAEADNEDQADQQQDANSEIAVTNETEVGDDDPDSFVELTEVFKDNFGAQLIYSLPPHRRCASHTLNLIANGDVYRNIRGSLANLKNSTESKLKSLWNKQNRSSKASDAISEILNSLFVIHNATRWNSFFDAVDRVKYFINNKKTALKQVFECFKIPYFRPAEEEYIREFVKIMRPLAEALDVLQADTKISIGYLLPTLSILIAKMEKLQNNSKVKHCRPFVFNIINGLNTRFSECFQDEDLIFAAMVHPKFKSKWLKEADKQQYTEKLNLEFARFKSSLIK